MKTTWFLVKKGSYETAIPINGTKSISLKGTTIYIGRLMIISAGKTPEGAREVYHGILRAFVNGDAFYKLDLDELK